MKKNDLNKKHEFWLINTSRKNVSVGDLNIYIKPGQHINLLDSKHHHYTLEQLEASAKSGSIYKKSNILKVVDKPPKIVAAPGLYTSTNGRKFLRINRPIVRTTVKHFEELENMGVTANRSEDQAIAEDVDISFDDDRPLIAVDKNYSEKETNEFLEALGEYDSVEDE